MRIKIDRYEIIFNFIMYRIMVDIQPLIIYIIYDYLKLTITDYNPIVLMLLYLVYYILFYFRNTYN